MALSLQDLLVGFDAGAPQAPRANAPAPRGTPAHDPFAALFANQSNSAKTNSAPAPRSTSAVRSTPASHAAQPSTAAADSARPQRPADQTSDTNTASTTSTGKTADKTDATSSTSDTKPTRADTKSSDTKSSDESSNDSQGNDNTANANATPAGVAAVVVDVVQMAQLANAPADDNDGDVDTAPIAGATAPGLLIANDVAHGARSAPAATSDTSAPATPEQSAGVNAASEPSAKGNKPANDLASLLAAFTAPDQSTQPTDSKVAKTATQTPSTDAPAMAPIDATSTAPSDAKAAPTSNGTPAPQASPVAQVAVQASRDPRATADAIHQVTHPNDSISAPQAATVAEAAAQIARPSETGKTAAPRTDASSKSAAHTTTKTDGNDATASNAPKDTATANAVAPTASTKIDTQVATVAAMPAPTPAATDGDDTQAPSQSSTTSAASPIAAPVAGGTQQAHQLYAKTAGNAPALPQVTVDQVVAHVAKAADDGIDKLTIQLKPLHLGAIEVKLEMHDDGGLAKATISADRPDTLDLLQRDSHRLERALENAGIKADTGSLSFNLRGDGGRQQPTFAQHQSAAPSSRPSYASDDTGLDTSVIAYLNARAARGGVDVRV
ncbi:MAG TPA: flagellar hook-length control protein FliK [Alphaproteobacteria bacterium]|jgi:flagellar hook-length control protein FliK|nr:flagellar hook-length control protein FliK [Alphaproteobacteria bacterium]